MVFKLCRGKSIQQIGKMAEKKKPLMLRVIAGNQVTLPSAVVKQMNIKEGDWIEIPEIIKLKISKE